MPVTLRAEIDKIVRTYSADVDFDENTNLERELVLDSIDLMQILVDIEKLIGINLDDSDMNSWETVGNIYDTVIDKINESSL